ncbi:MAG: hypothetical protein JWN95_560 [Frankiales bacterium]|nr:hypothetical protein [Frankiales bacterium]
MISNKINTEAVINMASFAAVPTTHLRPATNDASWLTSAKRDRVAPTGMATATFGQVRRPRKIPL